MYIVQLFKCQNVIFQYFFLLMQLVIFIQWLICVYPLKSSAEDPAGLPLNFHLANHQAT